jgi:cytochrome c553
VPQTAGQHASVVIKQLGDISRGDRDAPRMGPYARPDLLGGAQGIADVAGYLSGLPPNPAPALGPGDQLGYGGALYKTRCARLCHGLHGGGDARTAKPRIQGQHFPYLLRQLRRIRDGQRRNANKAMIRRLQDLPDPALEALADHVARLPPRSPR